MRYKTFRVTCKLRTLLELNFFCNKIIENFQNIIKTGHLDPLNSQITINYGIDKYQTKSYMKL